MTQSVANPSPRPVFGRHHSWRSIFGLGAVFLLAGFPSHSLVAAITPLSSAVVSFTVGEDQRHRHDQHRGGVARDPEYPGGVFRWDASVRAGAYESVLIAIAN